MRIIAGIAKGRNLLSPSGQIARPTSDRAREALFSSLESEFGNVEGISFLDLYAGSGAVAAEALSRGAKRVVAVESDRGNSDVARENIEMVADILRSTEESAITEVQAISVERFISQAPAQRPFDVIFLDPPYEHSNSAISELISKIADSGLIHQKSLVVVERESKSGFAWPKSMREVKARRYGHATMHYGELINQG